MGFQPVQDGYDGLCNVGGALLTLTSEAAAARATS